MLCYKNGNIENCEPMSSLINIAAFHSFFQPNIFRSFPMPRQAVSVTYIPNSALSVKNFSKRIWYLFLITFLIVLTGIYFIVVDKRMTEIGKTGLRGKCANETVEKEDKLRGHHYTFKN